MTKRFLPVLFCACLSTALLAQSTVNPPPDARFKADLLLVVAHPDDETVIGAYLARAIFDEKKRVAVVFGTRGNSGGNAQGQEQAASLSTIREIEARKALAHFGVLDVWFLNGLDTPGQDVLDSLETWNHGDSLGRLVRIVRLTRPAVVATWLPDWVAGENHGDHQAASVLANEAFDLAGNPTAFSEQLATPRNRGDIRNLTEGLRPWQPQKLYFFSDASHTDFLKGKGPEYSSTEKSPAKGVSYARLGAEECAFHLTQGDSGQLAANALAKNDLSFFEQPVLFAFGKSHVKFDVTGDLFEGVIPAGIPYERAPDFVPEKLSAPRIELGGPWRFYKQFWQAHGLGDPAKFIAPEIMARYGSSLVIPVVIDNPTDKPLTAKLSVALPEGWVFRRHLPASIPVNAHDSASVPFEIKTSATETKGWQMIAIDSKGGNEGLGDIRIRVQLDSGAMPQ